MRISDWSSDVCSSDPTGVSPGALPRVTTSAAPNCTPPLCWADWRVMHAARTGHSAPASQIGRALCRERVCAYEEVSVVAVSFTIKHSYIYPRTDVVQ